jgi:hypothetical protein
VVGDSWWMTRHEYDGSEYWQFHTIPTVSAGYTARVKRLSVEGVGALPTRIGWCDLEELQKQEEN